MNDPNFVPLVLGVLSVIVSISAFVLGDSEKNKTWRIGLGISFLFLAIILGTYGVVVLMIPENQERVVEQARTNESLPASANASALTDTLTSVTEQVQEDAQTSIEPTATSVPPTSPPIISTSLAQEPTATHTPTLIVMDAPPPAPPEAGIEVVLTRFRQVSLGSVGKSESGNLGLLAGITTLVGTDFEIGWMVTTRSAGDPSAPETVTLTIDEPVPSKIHFLLQGSWATSPNQEFGSVGLSFLDGRSISVPLMVGQNIRDWSQVNVPLTDPAAREAWRGVGWDGHTEGVVDELTIEVPTEYYDTRLTQIEVRDESMSRLGSPNPGIHLWAITLEE
jgi:hypothetical protein